MKKIIFILVILFLISFLGYKNAINSPLDPKGEEMVFVIERGEGVKMIGENLKQNNLIKSEFYYKLYVWRNKLEKNFKAGEYVLSPDMSLKEIVDKLTQGQIVDREITITIIEGWNIKNIDDYLSEKGIVSKGEFSAIADKPHDHGLALIDYDFLKDKPANASLEGYLFPDTYRIFKDASAQDAVLRMLNNFDKKVNQEMRDEIKKQNKTMYEILTMASLLEKEVRTENDMKIVSGIFWNRIKNSQRLESCATLAYILGENKAQYSIEDTNVQSPYNTYRNAGLPPGPIASPGLNAIRAAIYPTNTNFNYFLTDPKTGNTIFSATYNEHLRNKAKYLK